MNAAINKLESKPPAFYNCHTLVEILTYMAKLSPDDVRQISCAAAWGMVLAARNHAQTDASFHALEDLMMELEAAKKQLDDCRPELSGVAEVTGQILTAVRERVANGTVPPVEWPGIDEMKAFVLDQAQYTLTGER